MAPTNLHDGSRSVVDAETERQKTALVFRNAGIAQSVHVVNATLLAYVNATFQVSPGVAFTWCALVVAIAAGRYLLARRFRAAEPDAAAAVRWRRRYFAATTTMGAAWGAGTVLFMWNAPDGARMFTGLVLSGMVAGAVPLLAPIPLALRTFAGLVVVPMSAVVLLQAASPLHWAFGSMSLVFLVSVLASGRYLHETLDVAIRLGLEQQVLKAAVEQSSASIVVTDAEARIIFVNSSFTRITGYSPEEAIGQNPRLLKSGKMPKEHLRRPVGVHRQRAALARRALQQDQGWRALLGGGQHLADRRRPWAHLELRRRPGRHQPAEADRDGAPGAEELPDGHPRDRA